MKNMTRLSHQLLIQSITNKSTVIDATMGNGHDTVFLAKHAIRVFAFDIQEMAIINTRQKLTKQNITNCTLIKDSHENIKSYINEPIDAAIFNLGYLPGSDKEVVTKGSSTTKALNQIFPLLNDNGTIVLVVYVGHKGGLDEAATLEDFVKSLNSDLYLVSKYSIINSNKAPYIIQISKA